MQVGAVRFCMGHEMIQFGRNAILLVFSLTVSACSHLPIDRLQCQAGQLMTETTLYFGLSGRASVEGFETFRSQIIAKTFPEGYTVLDGSGGWYSARLGRTIEEPSKVVVRLHKGQKEDWAAIDALITTYKERFDQESVLRTDQTICAAF